jgi:RNA polymerase sigma-70 factor (ECF subfamily)
MNVGKVYALCLRLLADPELAEKLTVEVFLTTWQKINLFRDDTLFSSWLTGITTHTILQWIRNNDKMWNRPDEKKLQKIKDGLNNKDTDPFEIEILLLPGKERFVFVLHEIESYSDVEVADLLAITSVNYNEILQRAYHLLNLPEETNNRAATIHSYLYKLPQIVQPEKDLWKNVFAVLDKEHISSSKNPGENQKKSGGKNEDGQAQKKFSFLNWKKK